MRKLRVIAVVVMTLMLAADASSASSRPTRTNMRLTTSSMTSPQLAGSQGLVPELLARATTMVVYLLGNIDCPTGICSRLLRSNDDGLHFEQVTLPAVTRTKAAAIVDSLFASAQFANANDGYFPVNGVLYMTNDAARTWHVVSFGRKESVRSIATTPQLAYAALSRCPACKADQLVRSVTGSPDWSLVSNIPTNTSEGWLLAAATGNRVFLGTGYGTGQVTLSLSVNEGRTFAVVWREPMLFCGLTPTSDTVVWLDCSGGMMGDWFRSSDGGNHFSPLPIRPYHGDPFDPVSNTVAFYLPAPGVQVYRTTNAGESFEPRGEIPVKGAQGAQVSFANAQQGLTLVWPQNKLFRTGDGGVIWQPFKAPAE